MPNGTTSESKEKMREKELFFQQQRAKIKSQFHALWGKILERRGPKLTDYDREVKRMWGELQKDLKKYCDETEKLLKNGDTLQ